MSRKLTILAALFMVMMMAMAATAIVSINAKFVEDHIIDRSSSIVEFDIKQWDVSQSLALTPFLTPAEAQIVPQLKRWTFAEEDSLDYAHIEEALGYQKRQCWDTVTGQVLATTFVSSTNFVITATPLLESIVDIQELDNFTVVLRCAVAFSSNTIPTAFKIQYYNGSSSVSFDLAYPARGFITPLVNLKSASLSQSKDDPISSTEVNIEFTTDVAGVFIPSLINGPSPFPFNSNNGKYTNLWCTGGSGDKNTIRILYHISSYSGVSIFVPTPSPSKAIKCTLYFDNNTAGTKFVASDRVAIQLSTASVTVTRTLNFDLIPAGLLGYYTGQGINLLTSTTILSSTPLHTNSTVVIKFSKQINVGELELEEDNSSETSYRANRNCYRLEATSFVDRVANTITLKDIQQTNTVSQLSCSFEFASTQALNYQDDIDTTYVSMSIDGKDLVSVSGSGKKAPIRLPTDGELDHTEQQIDEETTSYTITDTFSYIDVYDENFNTMSNPILMVQLVGSQLFNMENYESQVKCSATSPTSTKFEELKLKFDEKYSYWSIPMDKIKGVEGYSILIKCTRSVIKITKYGMNITPENGISVGIYNIVDGKRFFKQQSKSSFFAPMQPETRPTDAVYPGKTIATGVVTAEFITPAINQANIDGAKANVTSWAQTVLEANTDNEGFTFTSLNVTAVLAQPADSYGYLMTSHYPDYFAYQTRNTNDLKSYFMVDSSGSVDELIGPEQIRNTNPFFYDYAQSVNPFTITVEQYFTAAKDQVDLPDWDISTEAFNKFVKSYFTSKYGSDILLPSASVSSSLVNFISPVTGCGVDAGFYIEPLQGFNYDFAPAAGSTETQLKTHWADFLNFGTRNVMCQNGQSCQYNADCVQGSVCSTGVCTLPQTYPLPYVLDVPSAFHSKSFDADYFNSASITSVMAVMIAVVAMIIF